MSEVRVVLLNDWPQPAAGAPRPRVLADDTTLSLLYRTADDRYAVVRFPLYTYLVFGAPNDEALAGHPLWQAGLRHYSVHEVRGSALVRELERRNAVHPRHDPALFRNDRHLVFTFQDTTLEVVASGDDWFKPRVAVYARCEEAEAAWRAEGDVELDTAPARSVDS